MDSKKMKSDLLDTDRKSSVALPVEYWKLILNLLDDLCEKRVQEMKDVPKQYLEQLAIRSPKEITQISGPLLTRALIVEQLVEDGFIKPEAREAAGLEWVANGIEIQEASDLN